MGQTMDFKQWKREVNKVVVNRIGMGCNDMPDVSYRDWYDDGMSPEEAADEAVDIWQEDIGD